MDAERLLGVFVEQSRAILGENLVGVYLHGSLAMGCFNPRSSDVDLLVVVREDIPLKVKRWYMERIAALHRDAPGKGLEMSVLRADVCSPFVYPTPFLMHFSAMHLERYLAAPDVYAEQMNGIDRDLAAHCMVVRHRGRTLYGKPIPLVFAEVPAGDYLDSILADAADAAAEIARHPVYYVLNLCRILAYRRERLILSKREGGEWALANLEDPAHRALVCGALREYETGEPMDADTADTAGFAAFMLGQITADRTKTEEIGMQLETQRLLLREMTPEDYDALYAVLADSDIMQHYPYTFDEKRVRNWIAKNQERYRVFGFGLWAVCLRSTGEMIGDCGLTMQNVNGTILPEIGYHIAKAHQRRGYAKEAARACRDWAFTHTPFGTLYSYMKKANEASAATARANGMTLTDEFTDAEGEQTAVYAISRVQWLGLKQTGGTEQAE